MEVSDLSEAATAAHPHSSNSVSHNRDCPIEAKVLCHGLEAKGNACPLADSPPSSASAELRVTVLCVLDQCLMRWPPLRVRPPEVERLVEGHPAKSVSTEVLNSEV